jgi:hypothetical protein
LVAVKVLPQSVQAVLPDTPGIAYAYNAAAYELVTPLDADNKAPKAAQVAGAE